MCRVEYTEGENIAIQACCTIVQGSRSLARDGYRESQIIHIQSRLRVASILASGRGLELLLVARYRAA